MVEYTMLKPAIIYKQRLSDLKALASMKPHNKYYSLSGFSSFGEESNYDNYHSHSFVSVDSCDNVLGAMFVGVDRQIHSIYGLELIKFEKEYSWVFSKDIIRFFKLMFGEYKYNQLNFSVCVGSPNEKYQDKFIKKYNGRIVGIKKNHIKLWDGSIKDEKLYEITRENICKELHYI
jgi:hypothetical protein